MSSENTVSLRMRLLQVTQVQNAMRKTKELIRDQGEAAQAASRKVSGANRDVINTHRRRASEAQVAARREVAAHDAVARSAEQSARRQEQANQRIERSNRRSQGRPNFRQATDRTLGGNLLSRVTGALSVYGVAQAGIAGIRAYDQQKGMRRLYETRYGKGSAVDLVRRTRELADELGLPIDDLRAGMRGLSNRLNPDELLKTMTSFAATGAGSGANAEGLGRALVQYMQVAMAGRLQGDELRIMQENGVDLRRVIDQAGLSSRVGSQTDPITFEELNRALIEFGGSAENMQLLKEAAKDGSADLVRMSNIIRDDLLPAIGKEATPIVRDLATAMREGRGVMVWMIRNWKEIGATMTVTWLALKAAKAGEMFASMRASKALIDLAIAAQFAASTQGGGTGLPGGGGGRGRGGGGGWWRRGPVRPGTYTQGMERRATGFRTALQQAAQRAPTGTGWASTIPWWMRGVGSGTAGGAITAGGTALAVGGLSLAAIHASERMAGVSNEDGVFGRYWNARFGLGNRATSEIMREMNRDVRERFEAVKAAKKRKEFYERFHNQKLTNEQYAMMTGDTDIFQLASQAISFRRRNERRNAYYEEMWEAGRARHAPRPATSSPRRASVDRANAEAQERTMRGMDF